MKKSSTRNKGTLITSLKYARFAGELCKMGLLPPSAVLKMLTATLRGVLVNNSQAHVAARLLETCGRFLLQTPISHQRMRQILAKVQQLEKRLVTKETLKRMLENARVACLVFKGETVKRPDAPFLFVYVRHLVRMGTKSARNKERTVLKLRSLDYARPQNVDLVVR
ncbi:MAG: hypothetical protein MHM6MM_009455 [Cercozoa sp. M6MM]